MRQLTDLVAHRVEHNLEAIRNTLLVDLPADRCDRVRACAPNRAPSVLAVLKPGQS